MINIANNTIVFQGIEYPIIQWVCWFMTPVGLISNHQEAVERVKLLDMDPVFTVVPVPVAVGPDQLYEVFVRA